MIKLMWPQDFGLADREGQSAVKPPAQPTLVRTQHPPQTRPGSGIPGPSCSPNDQVPSRGCAPLTAFDPSIGHVAGTRRSSVIFGARRDVLTSMQSQPMRTWSALCQRRPVAPENGAPGVARSGSGPKARPWPGRRGQASRLRERVSSPGFRLQRGEHQCDPHDVEDDTDRPDTASPRGPRLVTFSTLCG
jgi:hypothetical protein